MPSPKMRGEERKPISLQTLENRGGGESIPESTYHDSGEYVISRLMGLDVFHFLLSFTHTKIRSDRKNFGDRTTSQNPDLQETEGEILLTA